MSHNLTMRIEKIGQQARIAASELAQSSNEQRNCALQQGAMALRLATETILSVNRQDLDRAIAGGLTAAMIDRLSLNPERIEAMAVSLEEIARQTDPINQILAEWQRPNGLRIERVSTPLGVIAVIYEARPNVTADAAALCLKAGNAAILRCGSDSFKSAQAILSCLHQGLLKAGLSQLTLQDLGSNDRSAVDELLKLDKYVDVLVPRGGKELVAYISEHSKIPLFRHLSGLCHTYIHADASPEMAQRLLLNAKMRRTGICGATETLLLDRAALPMLPTLLTPLVAAGCELRGDASACQADNRLQYASEADWDCEYLDAILAIRVVENIDQALAHIARHGSQHTEAIISDNQLAVQRFLQEVDAAIVMHNASTQFADGGEFGMGAEIGIATGKLHARGPVGAAQLTSFKYLVHGNGQCRP